MSDEMENGMGTALVTGGSRGIGRAVTLRLAEACARTVVVNYVQDDAEARATRKAVEDRGSTCVLVKANLAYPNEIDRLFEEVAATAGRLDVFVHCAALGAFKALSDVKPNQWDLTMNINARSFLLCVQKCAVLMNGGSVVAVSSLGSGRVVPNYGAMGPTKAALESLVRYLAFELAPRGIRVNGVTSGLVETSGIRKMPDIKRWVAEATARTPSGRIGTPDDIADVIMFLTGPSARWICGQTIVADGGYSLL